MVVPLVNDVLLSLTAEQNESFIIKCVVNDGRWWLFGSSVLSKQLSLG